MLIIIKVRYSFTRMALNSEILTKFVKYSRTFRDDALDAVKLQVQTLEDDVDSLTTLVEDIDSDIDNAFFTEQVTLTGTTPVTINISETTGAHMIMVTSETLEKAPSAIFVAT